MTWGLGALASLQWACALDDRNAGVSSSRPEQGGMSGSGASSGLGQGGAIGFSGGAGSQASQGGSPSVIGPIDELVVVPMDRGDDPSSSGGSSLGTSVGSCPVFDACGGTLDGVWSYAAVCVEPAEVGLDVLQSVCPSASLAYQTTPAGTLRFENGSVSRSGAGLGQAEITFPNECADTPGFCADIALLLGEDAACGELAAGCACAVAGSVDWEPDTFESSAGQLLLGSGRLFDYCVEGDRLTYREAGDVLENGTYTLRRN